MNKKTDMKVKRLQNNIRKRLKHISESIIGEHAIVPRRKYAGRRALVEDVAVSDRCQITVLLKPYRLDELTEFVRDAGTYWPYDELIFCK